ncbi:hypothetical protein LTR64_004030 [Lithohypha guttulata]|uniref:Septin-type G domain-containing protein n=1 Tax=Lithohypha guttulata TaxID=1690604 RepID=A0AAN7YJM9_9EURO|nr:hypothetical protein LTR51_006676 [Lithohypha guttulata]KAK5088889.1 hypothetical protein LTR05_003111 [Lithohypha guttulata]
MTDEPGPERADPARRTTSFGSFIKRTKSNDLLGERKPSTTRLRKKSLDSQRRPSVSDTPPALPTVSPQPVIDSFGGENYNPMSSMSPISTAHGAYGIPPVPPLPAALQNSAADVYARAESMTHRSRYSYAQSTSSTVNSPRRVRRRKDPTPYNILVVGAKNSGKTSFIDFLKVSLALPPRKQAPRSSEAGETTIVKSYHNFTHHYQEIEVDNERVGLTLWDSQGLDKGVVDLQLRELTSFVENKFEETFAEEMKVVRSPGVGDTKIHCVFMILDPSRLDTNMQAAQESSSTTRRIGKPSRIIGALDEDFELQVLKSFQGKTTVVPIISKADTVTTAHMAYLKQMVWQSLKQAGLDPLEALNVAAADSDDQFDEADEDDLNDHEEGEDVSPPGSPRSDDSDNVDSKNGGTKHKASHNRTVSKTSISSQMLDSGYVPMSILSPDRYSLDPKNGPVGRQFPWGFADPYSSEHCDFVKLKDAVFSEWRNEVREASREIFYERWRTNRLNRQAAAKVSNTTAHRRPSGGIPIQVKSGKNRF